MPGVGGPGRLRQAALSVARIDLTRGPAVRWARVSQGTVQSFAFDVLANYGLANAVYAAFEAGFWDHFSADPAAALDPAALAEERGLEPRLAVGLAEYLVRRGMLARDSAASFRLSDRGRELVTGHWLGYFVHLVGGYGKVLQQAGPLVRRQVRYQRDLVRDGRNVALGSELIGRGPHHRSYQVTFDRAGAAAPHTVLDLGCGSAGFLLDLVRRTAARRGIGVDVSADACALARQVVAAASMSDRVQIVHADARGLLASEPSLEGTVGVATAMFIVHEFFGESFDRAAAVLRDLCRVLEPGKGRLLIVDKATDVLDAGAAPPYFTEFKLVHDFTDQALINRAKWAEVLAAASLEVLHEEVLGPHTGTVLFECRPRR